MTTCSYLGAFCTALGYGVLLLATIFLALALLGLALSVIWIAATTFLGSTSSLLTALGWVSGATLAFVSLLVIRNLTRSELAQGLYGSALGRYCKPIMYKEDK